LRATRNILRKNEYINVDHLKETFVDTFFTMSKKSAEHIAHTVIHTSRLLVNWSVCAFVHFTFYRTVSTRPHACVTNIFYIYTCMRWNLAFVSDPSVKRPENGRSRFLRQRLTRRQCDSYTVTPVAYIF